MPYHEINDKISDKIGKNRDRYEVVINSLISTPAKGDVLPFVQIQCMIRQLLDSYRRSKATSDRKLSSDISSIASSYFYYMVNRIDEHVNAFLPAKDSCSVALSQLGVRKPQSSSQRLFFNCIFSLLIFVTDISTR